MNTSLFRHAAFTRFWLGDIASTLANQMLVIAVGWQIYDITNSAMSLGLVGLAHFGAQFLFTLPAGHCADRYDRRHVAMICQWIQCATALLLAAATYSGWINSEIIYAGVALTGMAQTFQNPAMRALLPSLVGTDLLQRCISFHAAAKKTAIIVGPALGGVIYIWGASAVYTGSAVFYALAGAIILTIHTPFIERKHEPVTLQYVFGGLHYIFNKPVILGAISLDLFATLLGGAVALLPIYAPRHSANRADGAGPVALGASGRRRARLALPRALAAYPQRGKNSVHLGGGVWRHHGGVRVIHLTALVAARTRPDGRSRHGERRHPPDPGATGNTCGNARPRQRRAFAVHRHLQSSGAI